MLLSCIYVSVVKSADRGVIDHCGARAVISYGLVRDVFSICPSLKKRNGVTYLSAMRCTVCRRRDFHSSFRTERESLAGDAKGKDTSGYNREVESTDAPERGGLPRISEEAGNACGAKGQVIAIGSGQPAMEGTRSSMEGGSLHAMARAV